MRKLLYTTVVAASAFLASPCSSFACWSTDPSCSIYVPSAPRQAYAARHRMSPMDAMALNDRADAARDAAQHLEDAADAMDDAADALNDDMGDQ